MKYTPKQKNYNMKYVILIVIAVFIVGYFGVRAVVSKKVDSRYAVCNLTHEETQEKLNTKVKDNKIYEISDYLFYGESLNLFKDTYDVEKNDDLSGKSIVLRDVCTKEEYAFMMSPYVDRKILLGQLEEGFYEVFVIDDLIEKRLVSSIVINDTLTTINRNGKHNEIRVYADKEYFNDRDIKLDRNYVFLQVKETEIEEDEYDIVIDPAALDFDFTYTVNKGAKDNGIEEYKATYEAATLLKENLEEKGLKVLLTRDADEEVNSYGEDGRLERAYRANAKYYIRLTFTSSPYNESGMSVLSSVYASDMLANQIVYQLKRNTGVNFYNEGIESAMVLKGKDGRQVYDLDLWIREAGGKATQASMYSDNAYEGTANFAKDNEHGIHAITLNLGYVNSIADVNYYNANKAEYMKVIADALFAYLHIE